MFFKSILESVFYQKIKHRQGIFKRVWKMSQSVDFHLNLCNLWICILLPPLVWHSIFDTATTLCPPPLLELHLSIYQEEQIVALNCILYPYITVSNIGSFRKQQQGKHNFTWYYYVGEEFFFLSSNAILFHLLLASSPVFFFLHNGTCLHLLCATSF